LLSKLFGLRSAFKLLQRGQFSKHFTFFFAFKNRTKKGGVRSKKKKKGAWLSRAFATFFPGEPNKKGKRATRALGGKRIFALAGPVFKIGGKKLAKKKKEMKRTQTPLA